MESLIRRKEESVKWERQRRNLKKKSRRKRREREKWRKEEDEREIEKAIQNSDSGEINQFPTRGGFCLLRWWFLAYTS